VGEIIHRFEAKGFTLVGLKFMTVSRNLAESIIAFIEKTVLLG
jgi:nucleoside-diphosphate kinase